MMVDERYRSPLLGRIISRWYQHDSSNPAASGVIPEWAEIEAPSEPLDPWRPMEMAPRDGTPVLVRLEAPLEHQQDCLRDLRITIGWYADWSEKWFSVERYFVDEEWYAPDYEGAEQDVSPAGVVSFQINPTGWMPLPEP